ncbi:MAG TPA: hypothetical protein VK852_07345 [Desulfobacterales bacterium]|nr:hypothetical protein [Desulfobacterales bacterium]
MIIAGELINAGRKAIEARDKAAIQQVAADRPDLDAIRRELAWTSSHWGTWPKSASGS